MYKFKIGDTVQITAGKDKGRSGKVLSVAPKDHQVIIEGLNQVKKHVKKTQNEPGKVITLTKPVSVANIALLCPSCQKTTRVGFDISVSPKVRVCHRCRQVINITTSK
jgi:large subunit ribosomal protein L24